MIVTESYLADHGEQPAHPSEFIPTNFKRTCLCHRETIDGVEYLFNSPSCELPGHGLRSRFVSEHATTPAKEQRHGGRPAYQGNCLKGEISSRCSHGAHERCSALGCQCKCHKESS